MRFQERVSPISTCRCYSFGELIILVGKEPIAEGKKRWHLSISHPARYPSWEEIRLARYELCPKDITMAMLMPPEAQYVNISKTCFHLWQIHKEDEDIMRQGGF